MTPGEHAFPAVETLSHVEQSAPILSLQDLADTPVQLTVVLGHCRLALRDVMELKPGSIVPLRSKPGDLVQVLLDKIHVASAETEVTDERLSIRISSIVGVPDA